MATKSFLKNVTIKNKKDCSKLLHALESAQSKKVFLLNFLDLIPWLRKKK